MGNSFTKLSTGPVPLAIPSASQPQTSLALVPTNQMELLNPHWTVIDSIDPLMDNSLACPLANRYKAAKQIDTDALKHIVTHTAATTQTK